MVTIEKMTPVNLASSAGMPTLYLKDQRRSMSPKCLN
jgi:hypothetical protein